MMSSNNGGDVGGPNGAWVWEWVEEGSRHDDEATLTGFLSSLMDYTPMVWCHCFPLAFLTFCKRLIP
jgi:transcription initiation factor TFIID subunit 10